MKLEQKYLALIQEAKRRKLPDVEGIRLCFQTLSLSAAIDRDCAALLAPHGLSEGRFVLLFLLDGLERDELIERHAVAGDRRALSIRLTQKGKRVAKKVFEQHGHWIASLYGNLSAAERTQLAALLDKVAGNLPDKTP